eukprot:2816993-Amphidinium_carterae.1
MFLKPSSDDNLWEVRAAAQKQSRRRAPTSLIPEFGSIITTDSIPSGSASRLLRVQDGVMGKQNFVLGIYREPKEFMKEAAMVMHPFDASTAIPVETVEAMKTIAELGPEGIVRLRKETLAGLLRRRAALAVKENEFKAKLPEHVKSVLGPKQILLLDELLKESGFQDRSVVQDLTSGIKLTGADRRSGCFPSDVKPASLSESELKGSAVWRRKALVGRCSSNGQDGVDERLWDETLKEVRL